MSATKQPAQCQTAKTRSAVCGAARTGRVREKHDDGEKHDQVAFRVMHDATKTEIKAAIELLFKVQVDRVSILNQKGKQKRFGRFEGGRERAQGVCQAEIRAGIDFAQEVNKWHL